MNRDVEKVDKIYALKDPLTHKVMYVGKTFCELDVRLDQHIKMAFRGGNTPRDRWVRSLIIQNQKPVIDLIETVTGNWEERERYYIKYYNTMGGKNDKLTNGTVGGAGVKRL